MGLLGVLHLALVAARLVRHVLGAVQLRRLRACRLQGRLRQRRRVGAHVGDVAVLVEPLRDAHRRLRREAELPARVLLQRRRHERRARLAGVRLLLDAADGEGRFLQALGETSRGRLVELQRLGVLERAVGAEVAALRDALAVDRHKAGVE
jgi:hypothetical protein